MASDKRAHLPESVLDLDDREHYSDTSRIKGLSDGVFSIAMTLLAFSLIEHMPAGVSSPESFVSEFGPLLVVYAMTFIILGTYWVGHAIQFHYVIRSDRPLMVRTILFLLFVSVVPFSAAYLGRFPTDHVALAFYCLNLMLCGASLQWTLLYATRDPLMLHHALDRRIFRGISVAFLVGPACYALALLVSFASTLAAFVVCVATPILTFFPNPFWGRLYRRVVGRPAFPEVDDTRSAR